MDSSSLCSWELVLRAHTCDTTLPSNETSSGGKTHTELRGMSHMCGRTSSAKNKSSKVFYKKIRPAYNDALSTSRVTANCNCVTCTKSDGQHKMKRLRTRKERNQMRDCGKEGSTAKSCHYHYSRQSSKDTSHVYQCCHNTFVTDKFPNIVPAAHEPSVITDSRLIGHHGLFNHEVKSIDIERLLSEQRKLDRSGQLKNEKISNPSLHLSAFANSSPNESKHLSECTNDEGGTSKEKDQSSTKTFNDSQEQKNKILQSSSQLSDLTPGQRPKKTFNPSTEMNNDSSKHSSSDVVIIGIKEAQPSLCEDNRESHQTPSVCKENVKNIIQGPGPSIIERTPKIPASATNQKQVSHPSPLQPSSLPTAGASNSTDIQLASLNTDSVAVSVKAVAASLCNSVSFSLLRKRNLVAESREVLMKALRQKHGGQLQANILEVQRRLYSHGQREVSELCQSPVFSEKEGLFGTDEFTAPFKAASFATSSLKKTGRLQFNWNSNDWSNPHEETAACLGTPAENLIGLDGTFSCRCSPQFCMDFDFQNAFSTESEHLFPLLPTSSRVDGPRSSGHVEDIFISTKEKELAMLESTTNFINLSDTRRLRYSRSPLTSVGNNHYSYVPHHSVSESVLFPQVHNSFEAYRYSFGKSFSEEIPHFQQESSFEPFNHFNYPSASPALRPHHVDLAHYPPSYMLERGPTLSAGSSFPSPEHWSFPPMRLY